MSISRKAPEASRNHRIAVSLSQEEYRSVSEHAWRRRTSMSELVLGALRTSGLTEMPTEGDT